LVVGGYHGNVNADLWAYTLPPTLASRSREPYEPETVCPRHHSHAECASNPECGWCSVDSVCYGRTLGVNCTTNLQTRRCPGICPALGTCHSCLVHGDMSRAAQDGSVAEKLKLGQCTWCVQNARCHHKDGKSRRFQCDMYSQILLRHSDLMPTICFQTTMVCAE